MSLPMNDIQQFKLTLNRLNRLLEIGSVLLCLAVCLPSVSSAQVLADPSTDPDYNVARSSWGSGLLYISDVVVESDSPDPLLNEKIDLIDDDETLTSELPDGRSVFMIRLKNASIVNSFRFYNFEAEGSLMAYVRTSADENADSPWIPVSDTITYNSSGPVVLWFNQEIEATLVRIVFDTAQPGNISGFGVAGTFFQGSSPKQTQLVRQTQATDNQSLNNVLSFTSGADVMGTSGGMAPSSKAMIDDLVETSHVFPETNAEPVALIDMGEPREIERVTVLIDSPAPTQMELYFIDDLDDIEGLEEQPQPVALIQQLKNNPLLASNSISSWIPLAAQAAAATSIREITVPPSFFDNRTPNVVAEFEPGDRRARANVGGSSFSQYVLVRWVYEDGLPAEFGGLVVCELNFLGRYVWYYEGDPDAPAEGPEGEMAFINFGNTPPTDSPPPQIPPPVTPPVSP
jgi:hypothetical protein